MLLLRLTTSCRFARYRQTWTSKFWRFKPICNIRFCLSKRMYTNIFMESWLWSGTTNLIWSTKTTTWKFFSFYSSTNLTSYRLKSRCRGRHPQEKSLLRNMNCKRCAKIFSWAFICCSKSNFSLKSTFWLQRTSLTRTASLLFEAWFRSCIRKRSRSDQQTRRKKVPPRLWVRSTGS